ncbi:MAG: alpha/beta hydrolase family protein [Myxococcales bacterium]|jgi:alpha-beta hydrolase superfamily lysophospholipase
MRMRSTALIALFVLGTADCRFDLPPRGEVLARYSVLSQKGDAVGAATLWAGAPDAWIEEIDVQDEKGRRAIEVRGLLSRSAEALSHYRAHSRSGIEVEELEVWSDARTTRWRRQKGLAIERAEVPAGAEAIVNAALLPTTEAGGSLALWCDLARRLPLEGPDELNWNGFNLRSGTPMTVFVSRRERRQVEVDGRPRDAVRFFVNTRASGHTVWVDAETRELLFVDGVFGQLVRQGLARPARHLPERPASVVEAELKVRNGPVELAGTLSRPADAAGPLPAVLLIHGSGPMDRDESPLYVFRELAHRLSEQGFAVLRYDKRGVGESCFLDGERKSWTLQDLTSDAQAWLAQLASREDIDGDCLFTLGHSEGGIIAPLAAAKDGRVAGVALLAGPIDNLLVILREQLDLIARAHGLPEKQLEEARRTQAVILRRLRSPAASPETEGETTAWLRSHAAHDPVELLRGLEIPVLGVFAAGDLQVPVGQAQRLRELAKARAAPTDVQVFDGLDHAMMADHVERSGMGLLFDPDRRVAPRVPDAIAAWLSNRPCVQKQP